MNRLQACWRCSALLVVGAPGPCPHCEGRSAHALRGAALAALLGVVAGCEVVEPDVRALYGAEIIDTADNVDADGDGYPASVDCDDDDPAIHPDAEETPEDGVDSNCNDSDNV